MAPHSEGTLLEVKQNEQSKNIAGKEKISTTGHESRDNGPPKVLSLQNMSFKYESTTLEHQTQRGKLTERGSALSRRYLATQKVRQLSFTVTGGGEAQREWGCA